MVQNLFLSIGGTGARIVESLIPCLAAGLGPNMITVGFVDQDQSNGNVTRARQRLANYVSFRKRWSEGPNRLDWGNVRFARSDVRPLNENGNLWCPHPERSTTLADILNRNLLRDGKYGQLTDMLFHPDKREQLVSLGDGYRGMPHIGATAFVSKVIEGPQFWRTLEERIQESKAGEEVRIFLAGSVFGGTGAAGFPTIARVIRSFEREKKAGTVRLGGFLMLPYFTFTPPQDSEVAAKPEDLLLQAQGALKYYGRLLGREQLFNKMYLMGWNPTFRLNYGSPGSSDQANPPLPPDLFGALAALDFFATSLPAEPANDVLLISRESQQRLCWGDLPPISAGSTATESEEFVLPALGQLLRFCSVWRNTIRPQLRKGFNAISAPAWARVQGAYKLPFNHPDQAAALDTLDSMLGEALVWAGSMEGFATEGGLQIFDLWDTTTLICRFERTKPTDPVSLKAPLEDDLAARAFAILVRGLDPSQQPRSQADLINEISEEPARGDHQGLGRLLSAVFHGSRLFNQARLSRR